MDNQIKLAHGSGRGLSELLQQVIVPMLYPQSDCLLEDAAVLPTQAGQIAFTTDAFVVQPIEFPGGDIGKLAACGTINDLAMMGAIPQSIAVSLILEEGLALETLRRILASLCQICRQTRVKIVAGDTKVVNHGSADQLFITTSGIGLVPPGRDISVAHPRPGDAVIVSGPIGLHGIAILAQRQGLAFASQAISDCAPLTDVVEYLLAAVPEVRTLRDATRGGCASVLNEIAMASQTSIVLNEAALPVPEVVKGACQFLGMDPLQIANEGCFVAVVPEQRAADAIAALRTTAQGKQAAHIGRVRDKSSFPVYMETILGGSRLVENPPGELLPRIC